MCSYHRVHFSVAVKKLKQLYKTQECLSNIRRKINPVVSLINLQGRIGRRWRHCQELDEKAVARQEPTADQGGNRIHLQ